MLITKDMGIGEIVRRWPDTVIIFQAHGMRCLGCAIAHFETLEDGALAHGIDLEALLEDLNMVAAAG